MFEYIFTGFIAFILLLIYILINRPEIASRLFVLKRRHPGKNTKIYMGYFREHKQGAMSRSILYQVFPWLLVLGLFFVLSSQYFVFATVLSGSMEPTFQRGDLVLMQRMYLKADVGDIIMFPMFRFQEPVTHRVVDITEEGKIVTQGDANPFPDSSGFPPDRVAGKAVLINNEPLVLKGLGYHIRPENIGEQKVLTKKPKSFLIAEAFNQFRAIQPLLILFTTIFYFFVVLEKRMENSRRFGNGRKNGSKNGVAKVFSNNSGK